MIAGFVALVKTIAYFSLTGRDSKCMKPLSIAFVVAHQAA
jgi:hypothetical protein